MRIAKIKLARSQVKVVNRQFIAERGKANMLRLLIIGLAVIIIFFVIKGR